MSVNNSDKQAFNHFIVTSGSTTGRPAAQTCYYLLVSKHIALGGPIGDFNFPYKVFLKTTDSRHNKIDIATVIVVVTHCKNSNNKFCLMLFAYSILFLTSVGGCTFCVILRTIVLSLTTLLLIKIG